MRIAFGKLIAAACFCALATGAGFAQVELRLAEGDAGLRAQLVDIVKADAPAADNRFEALRRARRAAEKATQFLNSEGYLRARVDPSVDTQSGFTPVLNVRAGLRFQINDIATSFQTMEGADLDRAAMTRSLDLSSGDYARAEDVVSAERRLVEALRAAGYADAAALERDVFGDADLGEVDLELRFAVGPRVRFGEVRYDDGVRTRRVYLERLIPFEPGDIYTPAAMDEFNRRLASTRIYRVANASLAPAGESGAGEEIRDVRVSFIERDRYSVAVGGSFSSSEGAGLNVSWTRRNATRRGDILTVDGTFAALERSIAADWRFPNAFGYGRSLTANVESGREETDAFDRDFAVFSGLLDIEASPNLSYTLGSTWEFTRETDEDDVEDLRILSVSAAVLGDWTDSLLEPRAGWRAGGRIEPGWVTGDEETQYVRLTSDASVYHAVDAARRWVLAGRARVGSVLGAQNAELPPSRRFFAGGGGSVRGYAFQAIGPVDDDNTPIGGRGLLELNAEARWRRDDQWGFAAFVDAGSVSSNNTPDVSDLRIGAGLGLRYYTAIGALRLDLATPLSRSAGDDALQVYINLGQAF